MVDFGLSEGVKELWEEGILHDFTIKVGDQEVRAHKVVLCAVSHYFRAMLRPGFVESNQDCIELVGVKADDFLKLLKLIYTSEIAGMSWDDTFKILKLSMYLQIPKVSEFCISRLMSELDTTNCFSILVVATEYSFHKEEEKIKEFVKSNWDRVVEDFNEHKSRYEIIECFARVWLQSEWELFLMIKKWVEADSDNRNQSANKLFSHVRFCLIKAKKLETIPSFDVYTNTDGSWHDLVQQAVEYHKLPVHLKVLDESVQSLVRSEQVPAVFSTKTKEKLYSGLYLLQNEEWKKIAKEDQIPILNGNVHTGIAVNNFYIANCICEKEDGSENQIGYIFDPRILTWSEIAGSPRARYASRILHHDECLYIVGGYYKEDKTRIPACEMEIYHLRTNTWTTSPHTLPFAVDDPTACVLNNTIYIMAKEEDKNKGREGGEEDFRTVLYALDLLVEGEQWQMKKSLESILSESNNFWVVKVKSEDVLVVVDGDLGLYYYSPAKDRWFGITNDLPDIDEVRSRRFSHSVATSSGNTVYYLNVITETEVMGQDVLRYRMDLPQLMEIIHLGVCYKWKVTDSGDKIEHEKERMPYFTPHFYPEETECQFFCECLAFSPGSLDSGAEQE